MTTNEKRDIIPQSEQKNKGGDFSLKKKVLSVLESGGRVTAIGLNKAFAFNDARKILSCLRQDGHPIIDVRLPDGRKMYFLKPDGQIKIPFEY